MKSLTGQYECLHRSGIGLDYFTSHIDRLTLQANGRFNFVTQEKSRIGHAAKALLSGQQVDMNAPEVRREGRARLGADPWAEMSKIKQTLPKPKATTTRAAAPRKRVPA